MRALLAGLALALLPLGACKCAPAGDPGAEVLAVLHAQSEAWNRGDVEGFMAAGYWPAPELTFYSQGSVTHGYDAVLERYRKRYKSDGAEMGRLEFSAIEVQPLGEGAAIARGRWDLAFAKKPPVGGLFTLVLKHLPQGWRVVHDHTSVDAAP